MILKSMTITYGSSEAVEKNKQDTENKITQKPRIDKHTKWVIEQIMMNNDK